MVIITQVKDHSNIVPSNPSIDSSPEGDPDLLHAKIDSALMALQEKTNEVETLRLLKDSKLATSSTATTIVELQAQLDKVTSATSQNEDWLRMLQKGYNFYQKKRAQGNVHLMDELIMHDNKFQIMERNRQRVERDTRSVQLQIQAKEKEYYDAATQYASQLDIVAKDPQCASASNDLETLRQVVKLQEYKNIIALQTLNKWKEKQRFANEWRD